MRFQIEESECVQRAFIANVRRSDTPESGHLRRKQKAPPNVACTSILNDLVSHPLAVDEEEVQRTIN